MTTAHTHLIFKGKNSSLLKHSIPFILLYFNTGNRFQNILITIGETVADVATTNTNSPAVCAYHPGQPDDVERFNCSQRMYGRYVRVAKINFNNWLNLYEIEVIGF